MKDNEDWIREICKKRSKEEMLNIFHEIQNETGFLPEYAMRIISEERKIYLRKKIAPLVTNPIRKKEYFL